MQRRVLHPQLTRKPVRCITISRLMSNVNRVVHFLDLHELPAKGETTNVSRMLIREALLFTMSPSRRLSHECKANRRASFLPETRWRKRKKLINNRIGCMKSLATNEWIIKSWISMSRWASAKLVCHNDMQSRKLLSSAVSTLIRLFFLSIIAPNRW